jgi:peroxiredoxin
MTPWPWPAPVDDGEARHLVRSLAMPDVRLPTTSGREISFRTLPGRAVVFCYTWTGRPGLPNPPGWDVIPGAHGSTAQAQDFGNQYPAFVERGVAVFGVSTQGTDHQREFAERLNLPFEIVSDAERKLQQALKLPTFETGGVAYLKRLTLALCDGCIERIFYPVHPPDAHGREVLAWLSAAPGDVNATRPKSLSLFD